MPQNLDATMHRFFWTPGEFQKESKVVKSVPVSSISCTQLEKLRLEKPEVVERCSATAGLSLGECPLPFQKLACQNDGQLTVE